MGSHAVNEDGGVVPRAHGASPHTATEQGWRVLAVLSALMGFASISTDLFGSALVGTFADRTTWPMAWVMALAGLGTLLCMRLISKRRPQPRAA